jgi:spore maturation protein CgeB
MMHRLRLRFFAHSWVSDWNHGNAHFLRGLARELIRMGHDVRCYEPLGSWSLTNLVRNEGDAAIEAIDQFRRSYPELDIHFYRDDETFADFARQELHQADVVIVHEWNEPRIVNAILALKDQLHFTALFHDTHHRAYTNPGEILRFHLHKFDGVIAFGEAIRRIYADGFGIPHAWTMHEAADVQAFRPISSAKRNDLVWIGNWGDGERTRELDEFLFGPVRRLALTGSVHGVRYPAAAVAAVEASGLVYRGWLPNHRAPEVFARHRATVHVPRRPYVEALPGVPTIRVFEALAAGIPLVSAPWDDAEDLFRDGDFLVARSGGEMEEQLRMLLHDPTFARATAARGRETILARHTCAHRAVELVGVANELARLAAA